MLLGDVKVDTQHWAAAVVEERIDSVVKRFETSTDKHLLLASLLSAQTLNGDEAMHDWQERIAEYPRPLKIAMVKEHLVLRPTEWLTMLAERDEWLLFWTDVLGMQKRMFHILCALNNIYFPGFKWARHWLDKLPIRPQRAGERLASLFSLSGRSRSRRSSVSSKIPCRSSLSTFRKLTCYPRASSSARLGTAPNDLRSAFSGLSHHRLAICHRSVRIPAFCRTIARRRRQFTKSL